MNHARTRTAATLAAAALAAFLAPAPARADWPAASVDPHPPVPGQIALPIPCEGAMVFVPVETPVAPQDPLADRELKLGGADRQTGFSDFFRTDFLRGGFTDADGRVLFYMARYEVTRDQWQAVMSGGADCPDPGPGGARPQPGVSWFDAIDFTRRLTEWVRANAPDAMPAEDGAAGHVRLPTDAEWEFAARGGVVVGDQQAFRDRLPPMETDISDHAWYAGRLSSNGSLRPIGTKRPNPLGLDGMFGGVEELILEPYRLNNLGRLGGQIGGFVTRGGSVQTEETQLSSALRIEWPFFDTASGRANSYETIGLRPVISVHVNTSTARTSEIRDRWMEGVTAEPGVAGDPLAVLDALADRESEQRLLDELAFVRGRIVADRRARQEAADRALRLSLLNGAVLTEWMRETDTDVVRQIDVLEVMKDFAQTDPEMAAQIPAKEIEIAEAKAEYDLAAGIYLDTLYGIADAHDAEDVRAQADRLIIELAEQGKAEMTRAVERFVANIARLGAEPGRDRETLLDDAVR